MAHIATVFGTRPEAIKMAPLVQAIDASPEFTQTVVVTAQHRQMLDQVLDLFSITPDRDLDLMTPDQSLDELTSRVLRELTQLFGEVKPDVVLVQGDTTTTFAGALAAYYNKTPVGHVEAGLRTGNPYSPWPEEINRQLTTRMAAYHFAPTERARDNLRKENIADEAIEVTGNTVIDALLWVSANLDQKLSRGDLTLADLMGQNTQRAPLSGSQLEALERSTSKEGRLVLITGHRRESLGGGFKRICEAISQLADRYADIDFVYPVHLNPRVQTPVRKALGKKPNIHLLPPLDYLPFVFLMKQCTLVLTDSGGIQEEAPSLGKPVLVMRDTTERPEGVDAGTVKLVGTDVQTIVGEVCHLLDDSAHYAQMSTAHNPFGDGTASKRIVERLKRAFS